MNKHYYVAKNTSSIKGKLIEKNELPVIWELNFLISFNDKNNIEGPFKSKYEIQKKSIIFSQIKLQKHKTQILNKVKQVKDFILIPKNEKGYSYEFIKAFEHARVGWIEKRKVKGVHFYNPEEVKIQEIIKKNELTGVFSARISKLNSNTNEWIEKEEITNFFPKNWTLSKLFIELENAFNNKELLDGRKYIGKSIDEIKIIFIIENEKILTVYPLL